MSDASRTVALSIVVPVYNGALSVPVLVRALSHLTVPGGIEIVLVNDCSPDNSLEVCRGLCRRDEVALTVVNLARNFGEHNAVMAGLRYAHGAHVITMDDDLQNPPEEVVRLWHHAKDNDYDVVYSYYAVKKHSSWRNLGSCLTNWCADHLLDKPKGLYLSTFRCMNAFTVKAVLEHTGPFPYIDGLIMQVTQNIGRMEVAHSPRETGESNYTLRRLVRLFLSMFLNFSVIPLRMATLIGTCMAALGVAGLGMGVSSALKKVTFPSSRTSALAGWVGDEDKNITLKNAMIGIAFIGGYSKSNRRLCRGESGGVRRWHEPSLQFRRWFGRLYRQRLGWETQLNPHP